MNLSCYLPIALLIFGTGACQSTQRAARPTSVDEALLLQVSAAERDNIAAARRTCDQARDAHAAAQADYANAAEIRSVTGRAHDAAIAKVDRCEDVLAHASRSGTAAEVSTARQELLNAKSEADVQDAKVALGDKQMSYLKALVILAKERVSVAEASVELAKAKAVNTLDRPESQKPEVSTFETALRLAEGEENLARTRSEAAHREVVIASATLRERESADETLRRQ